MGVLHDIIDTAKNISAESKTNKFNKRKITKQKEALKKDIDKLTKNDTSIPVKVISEYCEILYNEFKPFGQYLHCRRAISNSSSIVIIFEYNLTDNDTVVVSIHSTNEDESECLINYSYLKNHCPMLSFTDTDITILSVDNSESDALSLVNQAIIMRNSSTRCIMNDIKEYVYSFIL